MAYGRYGRRRQIDPYEAEKQKKAEEKERAQKARFERLLRQYRQVRIMGAEADRAWKEPARRSLYGKEGPVAIIRGSGSQLFLQSAGPVGWNFYRLVPRYHTPRESEQGERDRKRVRSSRDRPKKSSSQRHKRVSSRRREGNRRG